jgi:hypothetical protein
MRFFIIICVLLSFSCEGQISQIAATTTSRNTQNAVQLQDPTAYFGANLKMWINGTSSGGKTLSGTFGNELDALTTNDVNAKSFVWHNTGTTEKVKFNGKNLYVKDFEAMYNTDRSYFKFLSDGTPWTISFRFIVLSAGSTDILPILNSNGSSPTQKGIYLAWNNNSPTTNGISMIISRGVSGYALAATYDNICSVANWHTVTLTWDNTNVECFVDGVSAGTIAKTNALSNTTPTQDLFLFKLSGSESFGKNIMLKQLVILDKVANATERTYLQDYLAQGSETMGSGPNVANVYFMAGQSNMSGMAPVSGIPSYLTGQLGSYIYANTNMSNNTRINIEKLQAGVNHNSEGLTFMGPELEFGYRMNAAAPGTIFLSKHAITGTPLFDSGSSNNWNISTGASFNLATKSINTAFIGNTLRILKYELDRAITIRGFLWRQGEADALSGNASYGTDLANLYGKFTTDVAAAGYDVSKCHLFISIVDSNFSPSRTFQSSIVSAQQAATSSLYYFPTSGYTLFDGTHFNQTYQIQQGFDFYSKCITYITE